jgi:hypothetical protein
MHRRAGDAGVDDGGASGVPGEAATGKPFQRISAAQFASRAALAAAFISGVAGADGGAPTVSLVTEMNCDPLPGPGKVQCVVRVRPVGGALRWSDAIVLAAPPFAPPLRTRVAAGDAKRNDAEGADFSLALAATGDGVGELKVLARATVCGVGGCRPVQAEGVAKVVVGAQGGTAR